MFLVSNHCAAHGSCVDLGTGEGGCPSYGPVCGCNGQPVGISGCNPHYAFGPVASASASEPDGGCALAGDGGDEADGGEGWLDGSAHH